jgi:hypothetical protein
VLVKPGESTQFSARLDAELVARLKVRSSRDGVSASQLAERYIDEGLRSEEFPGVVFRQGPAGRRAGLSGGPDVWEIVRDVRAAREAGVADPVATVALASELTDADVRVAAAYYAAYPSEIDARIAAEEELAERLLSASL